MVIGGSILFILFMLIFIKLAQFEKEIEIARIKAKEKDKKTKIKNSTIFAWVFILSAFAIIWWEKYRIQFIATFILSFIFGYIALKGEQEKEER